MYNMTKNKTMSFRLSEEDVRKLKEINTTSVDSSLSETLRRMIGREYKALLKAELDK